MKKTKKRKKWTKLRIIKDVLLLIIVIALFGVFMDKIGMPMYTRHGESETMPDLLGMTVDDARENLNQAGFNLIVKGEQYNSHYEIGSVIKQNPPAGNDVKKGRRVYVTISTGVKPAVVPTLTGESLRDALIKIEQSGLELGLKLYENNPLFPADIVCAQSIPRDTKVKPGTDIDITISLGSIVSESVVPDVRSLNVNVAIEKLRKANLRIGGIDTIYNENFLPYTVIWQSLPPDSAVSFERQIFLKISSLNKN